MSKPVSRPNKRKVVKPKPAHVVKPRVQPAKPGKDGKATPGHVAPGTPAAARRITNWLYPLSRTADRVFVDSDGNETEDTSYESFVAMMSHIPTDDRWYLATNYRNVGAGDRIWCYYGRADGDRGVVAVARVRDVVHDELRGTHDVLLEWEKTATRRLLRNPVPAARVREFIQRPRAPVWGLDRHPRLAQRTHPARELNLAVGEWPGRWLSYASRPDGELVHNWHDAAAGPRGTSSA
jgi:hypothetical protein